MSTGAEVLEIRFSLCRAPLITIGILITGDGPN